MEPLLFSVWWLNLVAAALLWVVWWLLGRR